MKGKWKDWSQNCTLSINVLIPSKGKGLYRQIVHIKKIVCVCVCTYVLKAGSKCCKRFLRLCSDVSNGIQSWMDKTWEKNVTWQDQAEWVWEHVGSIFMCRSSRVWRIYSSHVQDIGAVRIRVGHRFEVYGLSEEQIMRRGICCLFAEARLFMLCFTIKLEAQS